MLQDLLANGLGVDESTFRATRQFSKQSNSPHESRAAGWFQRPGLTDGLKMIEVLYSYHYHTVIKLITYIT